MSTTMRVQVLKQCTHTLAVFLTILAACWGQTRNDERLRRVADSISIARAVVNNHPSVEMLVLTRDERAFGRVQAAVKSNKDTVVFTDTRLGYLHLRTSMHRAEEVAASPDIEASLLDGAISPILNIDRVQLPSFYIPEIETTARPTFDVTKFKPGDPGLAVTYTGLAEFRRRHPTADGRGAAVAIIEKQVGYFDHPELRYMPGTREPKVTGIIASARFGEPGCHSYGGRDMLPLLPDLLQVPNVEARSVTTDSSGRFFAFGRTFVAPGVGEFCLGQQKLGRAGQETEVAFLWVLHRRRVWLDVNGDGDFRRVSPLGDFNETGIVGYLQGLAAAPNARGMPFIVVLDKHSGHPRIYLMNGAHATSTGSYAAGGRFSAAPEARLIYVVSEPNNRGTLSEALEEAVLAARDPRIDVLSISMGMHDSEGDRGFDAQFVNRIVHAYQKPVFWAAANGLAFSEDITSASNGADVVSVGGYINGATVRSLAGHEVSRQDYVLAYSRGPSRLGAMKPDLIAPTVGVSPTTCEPDNASAAAFPPCYQEFGGTSGATPIAAGVAAALVSGAKQAGIPFRGGRVTWAMKAGARFLEDWPAYAQGAGLIRMTESWDLLDRAAKLPDWRIMPNIEVHAPVRNRWNETADGFGLYEREGWTAGQSEVRTIRVARQSGPAGPVRYRLSWSGNDGTFSMEPAEEHEVSLALGKPVEIKVHINVRDYGIHSAQLRLIDPELNAPIHWISLVIVAAHRLSTVEYSDSVTANRELLVPASHTVDVPVGAMALRVDVIKQSGTMTLFPNAPLNLEPRQLQNSSYAPGFWATDFETRTAATRIYPLPVRGVWEFSIIDLNPLSRTVKLARNPHELAFTALAADVHATVNRLPDEAVNIQADVHNRMGGLISGHTVIEPAAMKEERIEHSLVAEMPFSSQFLVYPGVKTLLVEVEPLDGVSRLRPVLFDCARAPAFDCKMWDAPLESTAYYTVRDPDVGAWRIVVEGWNHLLKPRSYMLRIIEANPLYGTVDGGAAPAPRKSDERWTEQFSFFPKRDHLPPDFAPVALIEVRDLGSEKLERDSLARVKKDEVIPQRPVAIGWTVARIEPR